MTLHPPVSGVPGAPRNTILHGDCVTLMDTIPDGSVDFILTDPPYLVNYRPRSGQLVANDNGNDWLQPAANGMYRILKPDALCVSFYGWTQADQFIAAWRNAGFRPVGHIAFVKRYASSTGYLRGQHEMAYLLAKGRSPWTCNGLVPVACLSLCHLSFESQGAYAAQI